MPNLVGIGNSQVPTNAMLGGLAYQDPAHANLTNVEIENIAHIKGQITSTAVDVFVYDTRKDSDGGAWRKRCQHTSWYNEEPSATRGTRKEFPALAIIVLELQQLFIYDGDDPNCSMWMRFDCSTAAWNANATFLSVASGSGNGAKSCTALNGKLIVTGTYGVAIVDFINESQINQGRPGINASHPLRHKKSGNISLRNDTSGQYQVHPSLGYGVAIDDIINDCDATVLPNARIDDTTGLPIPTIALATDDGTSIIDENGKIVDMTVTGETKQIKHIHFTESNDIAIKHYANWVFYYKRPTADSSVTYWVSHPDYLGRITDTQRDYNTSFQGLPIKLASSGINNLIADRAIGHTNGLELLDLNVADSTLVGYGMHCGISTDFNSGWMVGNVTGAFLSDDDDTDISSAILQAQSHSSLDYTFASSGGWTANADWTISGGVATCDGQNNGRWIYPNANMFPIGSNVVVEVEVTARSQGTLNLSYGTGAATSGTSMTGIGTYHFSDICTGNQIVYLRSDSFVGSVDNVKMYIAEADRSHHDKGLAVYGTVTKTPVETGADLVAYGGFTSSNFLRQPPNSAMNIGTGDAHLMIWYKTSNGSGTQMLISYEGGANGTTNYGKPFNIRFESGVVRGWASHDNFSSYDDVSHGQTTADGAWHHAAWVRRGIVFDLYVDGDFINSDSGSVGSNALSDANSELVIGGRKRGQYPGDYCEEPFEQGSVALARIGKTAPTAEQIKKIYTDERKLFQENAKCTLYGGSYNNAIALAYDDSTDILHVGTTSGRNEFSGLRRINNTTTAVTTAVSASNGLVAEQ